MGLQLMMLKLPLALLFIVVGLAYGHHDKKYKYNKPYDKGYDKKYDKGYDKGYDKEESGERAGYNKGYDKGYNKGYDKHSEESKEETKSYGGKKGKYGGYRTAHETADVDQWAPFEMGSIRLPGVAKPLTLRIKVQPAANPSEPNEPQSARMDDDHTDFYTDFKPLHSARAPDDDDRTWWR